VYIVTTVAYVIVVGPWCRELWTYRQFANAGWQTFHRSAVTAHLW